MIKVIHGTTGLLAEKLHAEQSCHLTHPWRAAISEVESRRWTEKGKPIRHLGNRKQRPSRAGDGKSAKGEAAEMVLCSALWPGTCMALLIKPSQPLLPPVTSAATTKGSVWGIGKVEGGVITYPCSLTPVTSTAASPLAASNLDLHFGALKPVSKVTQFTHIVKSSDTGV